MLKFEKSKTTPRHSDADVCEQNGAASKVPSTVTDTPQPAAFRLASLLNRNDSEPDVTSHSSSSAGKYLHSQQQDIRDTWSRERSGKNTETKTLYQPQPQRNSLTAQQQSSFAIMKNNLFVPPAAAATYAPSSTPAAITTLTEEQKRYISSPLCL